MDEENREQAYQARSERAPGSASVLVLGLLSLIIAFIFSPASLVLGIIGLVKGNRLKRLCLSDGKSDAGWILSLLGIIFSSLGLLLFLPFIVALPMFHFLLWHF